MHTTEALQMGVRSSGTSSHHFDRIEAHFFGREYGDIGRARDPAAREQIVRFAAAARGVRHIFAINPQEFNAVVVPAIGSRFEFHDAHYGINVYHGALVDGVINLPRGAGFWMRSADCPTIVLTARNKVAVLHGGLRSLVVQHWRHDCADHPDRGSVIDHAIKEMRVGSPHIRAHILCGIGPDSYILRMDHPVHGPYNEQLVEHVTRLWGAPCVRHVGHGVLSLSLVHLITAQLRAHGIWLSNITWDEEDTAADKVDGDFRWWSQSRGDSERNHVLVLNPRV